MKLHLVSAFLLTVSAPAFAQQTASQIADAELPSLLTIYKDLHAHPELSGHEEKSAALVAKELKALGCEVTEKVGKYERPNLTPFGVVGVMKNGEGPVVLLRTDLDALPITEETGLPYASKDTAPNDEGKQVGVMQACGHDIHMSTFIGVARALAKLKDQWKGTILFIGQPAEEIGSGARAMLKDGLYTRWPKPQFALGFHDNAQLETGKLGITEGYTYASTDSIDVTVRGISGHGAYPHRTKDPIVLSAEIVNAWQTIASRVNNPLDPIVVTVGSIHGGTKHNIIPEDVQMQLTLRTYKEEVRSRAIAAIERIAKGCAIAAGVPEDRMPTVKVREDQHTPATYNNPELMKRLVAVWRKALGDAAIEMVDPTMGGEDFSEFSLPDHSIPAVDIHVGAVAAEKVAESKKPDAAPLPSLHSSKFAPVPEPTIRTGMVAMTSAVLDLMRK